jgi:signal peptidase II
VALVILLSDRLTKRWVESSVEPWETIPVIPRLFNIIHTRNRGMAFGIFNEGSTDWSRWTLITVSILVLAVLAYLVGKSWRAGQTVPMAFFLVSGGALGNLYDRMVYASVTDFLDLYIGDHHWPAFNIADSAITVGVLWLLLLSWRGGRASKAAEA